MRPSETSRRLPSPWLVLPFLAGGIARFFRLPSQIMGGDELHAVRAATEMSLGEILVTYRESDHSIPLSALYRILMDLGVEFTEMTFRLPILATGLLLLLLVPWRLERELGRSGAIILAWLVAFSPSLLLYSRIVRSYMPMTLFSFVAVMAFATWLRSSSRTAGVTYVLASTLAVHLHLVAFPFVLAPFAYALVERLTKARREGGPGFPALGLMLGAVILAIAVVLLPAAGTLIPLIEEKRHISAITLETVKGVLFLQAGTANLPLALAFWLLVAAGFFRLVRIRPRFAMYILVLAAGHLAGLLILSPVRFEEPLIFNRYVIHLLPFILGCVATALAWPLPAAIGRGAGAAVRGLTAGAFIGLLVLLGPFGDRAFRASSFTHHNDFMEFTCPRASVPASEVPAFYEELSRQTATTPIIEFPWVSLWSASRTPYIYQAVHGQPVLVSPPRHYRRPEIPNLRNLVSPSLSAFIESRARYLVFHRDLRSEEHRYEETGCLQRLGKVGRHGRDVWQRTGKKGRAIRKQVEVYWGDPVYSDETLEVWDIDRVREKVGTR